MQTLVTLTSQKIISLSVISFLPIPDRDHFLKAKRVKCFCGQAALAVQHFAQVGGVYSVVNRPLTLRSAVLDVAKHRLAQ